ncbi:RHS repeat-associated core domain-containing protein, partial [Brevundimonas sp. S30B]|uniref:RHS repeat-associated core domain-containing protein n=1 Tax=Brevundimonas sp. S30B TaxID=2561925 RepID=UPI002110E3F9
MSGDAGAATTVNSYDEYGVPGPMNNGTFQYTGQMWRPDAQPYHYRARVYAPQLGRFLQTDPIGYGDGLNLYGYVGGDPVNWTDPLGLQSCGGVGQSACDVDDVIVIGGCYGFTAYECFPNLNPWQGPLFYWGGGGGGSSPQRECSAPPHTLVGSSRAVLDSVATAADVVIVGLVSGGITAPIAPATKIVGWVGEAGLGIVNYYDYRVNNNSGPGQAQAAGLLTRLVPGGGGGGGG